MVSSRTLTFIIALILAVALAPHCMGEDAVPATDTKTAADKDAPADSSKKDKDADKDKDKDDDDDDDHNKSEFIKLTGRLDLNSKADGEKTENDFDGTLTATTGVTPVKAKHAGLLGELKEKAGTVVTLEGKMKEKDGQKYLFVNEIVLRPQPPSGFRNPRGL